MMFKEIAERKEKSDMYITELPPKMDSMFERLEELVGQAESKFKNKIFFTVNKLFRRSDCNFKNFTDSLEEFSIGLVDYMFLFL